MISPFSKLPTLSRVWLIGMGGILMTLLLSVGTYMLFPDINLWSVESVSIASALLAGSLSLLLFSVIVWLFREKIGGGKPEALDKVSRDLRNILEKRNFQARIDTPADPQLWLTQRLINALLDELEASTREQVKSNQLYGQIVESQTEFILHTTSDNQVIFENTSVREFLGFPSENAAWHEYIAQESAAIQRREELIEQIQQQVTASLGADSVQVVTLDSDGEPRWTQWSKNKLATDDSSGGENLLVGRDITDDVENEIRLSQYKKLATVGEMAFKISHEINQPLSVITMTAENIMELSSDDEIDRELVSKKMEQIMVNSQRAGDIIRNLKLFGRNVNKNKTLFDPIDEINNAIKQVNDQFAEKNISIDFTSELRAATQIEGDPLLFQQVLINILMNSYDALNQIQSEHEEDADQGVIVHLLPDALKENIWLSLEDNAGGVPQSIMDEMLQPFFSTKPPGQGSGLGLPLCVDIISKMGGEFDLEHGRTGLKAVIKLPCK